MARANDVRREKGNGFLFKRGQQYYLQIRIAGRSKTISLKTSDLREAEKKAAELSKVSQSKTVEEVAVHVKRARQLAKSGNVKLSDAFQLFRKSGRRKDATERTLQSYEQYFNAFKSFVMAEYPELSNLAQCSEEVCLAFAEHIYSTGISANTFNKYRQAMTMIFKTLSKEAGLEANPWKAVESKRVKIQGRNAFTISEVEAIFSSLDNPETQILHKRQMKTLCIICACTGLRLVDAATLEWNMINEKHGFIQLSPQKTRRIQREVKIPILPLLRNELKEAISWRDDSESVIPSIAKRHSQNVSGIVRDFQKLLTKIGIKTELKGTFKKTPCIYGFHSFRHYFATRAADAGCPVAVLADVLGDNISTLQKYYVHAVEESRGKLAAAFKSVPVIPYDHSAKISNLHKLIENLDESELVKTIEFIQTLSQKRLLS